jgi:hypothetical protein
MALREYDAARTALEAAWRAGYRSPEVAYALGLAALQALQDKEGLVRADAEGPRRIKLLREAELPPALAWLDKAKGAKVEVPEFGQGLLAEARDDWPAAEAGYRAALAKAPWMFEAWRALAHVATQGTSSKLNTTGPEGQAAGNAAMSKALEHLRQAEQLAPSDELSFVAESQLHVSWFISESASIRRSPEPIRAANAALDRARLIRPGSVQILNAKVAAVMQSAFLDLSTGGDPGPAVRDTAREFAAVPRAAFATESEFSLAQTALHHLWWIAAEADWRFGRDPRPALAEAARMRAAVPILDQHYAFSLLIEARDRIRRGENPAAVFEQATTLMRDLEASRGVEAWNDTIWGELLLEKAQWLLAQGTQCRDTMAEAAQRLERTAQTNPMMAYTFYYLPRLRALQARCALRQGADPRTFVQQSLDAARKGIAVNPRNAEVQLAAADAHLAHAQVRAARQQDPRPALDAAEAALRAAEATNPRHFRAALLRSELALEAAAWAACSGADAAPSLRRAEAAVRAGQQLKADEPAFKTTLARIQKLRTDPRATSATTM